MKTHNKAGRTIRKGAVIAAALSLALAAGAAEAHPKHGRDAVDHRYGYDHGHRHAHYRSKHMPRRMHHNKHCRRWYRHSAIRHNPYLPWWKVYRVYERQMALRHYRHHDRWRHYRDDRRYDRYDDFDDRYDDDRPRRRKRS